MREAVLLRDKICKSAMPLLEASGGITLDNLTAAAETGVDRIAVGAITHSAIAVDIGLDR
jgi:nicotinate-nucleotide pyrophosphorylase (carboxylating)